MAFAPPDIEEEQILAALALWRRPPRADELAFEIGGYVWDGRSLTPALKRLERKGLVRQSRDPAGATRWELVK